jgi:MFS family permease
MASDSASSSLVLASRAFTNTSNLIVSTCSCPCAITFTNNVNTATTARTASLLGAVNSLFAFGAAMGALIQGWASDALGRKKAIFASSIMCIIGGALTAGSVHIAMLIVVRLISGVGLGMIVTMSPLYIAEISPPRSRGLLVGTFAVFLGCGYILVAWISFATYYAKSETIQWRLPLSLAVVPALIMAGGNSSYMHLKSSLTYKRNRSMVHPRKPSLVDSKRQTGRSLDGSATNAP